MIREISHTNNDQEIIRNNWYTARYLLISGKNTQHVKNTSAFFD